MYLDVAGVKKAAKKLTIPDAQADPWMHKIPGLVAPPTPAVRPPVIGGGPGGSAGSISVPGQNWKDVIGTDPRYTSRRDAAFGTYSGAVKAAIARLGYVPENWNPLGGLDIQDAVAAGRENPYSTQKVLQRMYDENIVKGNNQMEARGIFNLGVGAPAQARGIEGVAAGGRTYDAVQSFLSEMGQQGGAYTGEVAGALSDTGTALAADPALSGAPQSATLNQTLTAQHGRPVYTGPDGRLYNVDGTTFTPPAAGAQNPAASATAVAAMYDEEPLLANYLRRGGI